jgi:hypothetical protein
MESEEDETEFFSNEIMRYYCRSYRLMSRKTDLCESMLITLNEIEKATTNFDLARVVGRGGNGAAFKEIRPRSCGNKKIEEIREVQEVSTLAVMCPDITVEKRPITWEVEMTLETIISKEHALCPNRGSPIYY